MLVRLARRPLLSGCPKHDSSRELTSGIRWRRYIHSMVKIRLMRVGMKGAPSYRIVVADAHSPRDGRIIENIGWYNPLTEPSTINVDAERAKHWLGVGAQP